MKASLCFVAGVAVLLFGASHVSAAPIVQTATIGLQLQPDSDPAQVLFANTWNFDRFDAAQGPLNSAVISVALELTGTVWETNPTQSAFTWTPFLWLDGIVDVLSGQQRVGTAFNSAAVSGAPRVMLPRPDPSSFSSFTGSLTAQSSLFVTSPAELALFTGVGPQRVSLTEHLRGNTFYGDMFGGGTATISVTYNVPETGAAGALLLLLAFVPLAVVRSARAPRLLRF